MEVAGWGGEVNNLLELVLWNPINNGNVIGLASSSRKINGNFQDFGTVIFGLDLGRRLALDLS